MLALERRASHYLGMEASRGGNPKPEPETLKEVVDGFLADLISTTDLAEPVVKDTGFLQPELGVETSEFVLSERFGDQVMEVFSEKPEVHIGEIVRTIFGRRLLPEEFEIVKSAMIELCIRGELVKVGAGYYGLFGGYSDRQGG